MLVYKIGMRKQTEIQSILGHTQISTTQRYAHLTQKTLIEAANAVDDVIDWS